MAREQWDALWRMTGTVEASIKAQDLVAARWAIRRLNELVDRPEEIVKDQE